MRRNERIALCVIVLLLVVARLVALVVETSGRDAGGTKDGADAADSAGTDEVTRSDPASAVNRPTGR